jgi:nucleoside-diphosphate-sugar epimerase
MIALVTGGGGFLGGALARTLVERGHEVRSFSRGEYPRLRDLGIEQHRGDLADLDAVTKAVRGCDVVFHVAARPGIWGPYEEYYRTNVTGTQNIIDACKACAVGKMVYTSSPSVVFHGSDQDGASESAPYPTRYLAHYPRTKATAERMVLAAHGENLATVALRPHIIWGPGDNHLVPRVLSRARAGKLRIVGTGKNLVDSVYVDNAVEAHTLACGRLSSESLIGGKAYFITNGEPITSEELINRILKAGGLPPVTRRVPAHAAYFAGALMELFHTLAGKKEEPLMTRFLARELSTSHWYDITAARQELGYNPSISIDEGMERLSRWLSENPTPESR